MKQSNIFLTALGVVGICSLLSSCEKTETNLIAETTGDFSNKAVVQVVVAAPNVQRNYIYANSRVITGATIATGSLFPASGNGYSFDPGLTSLLIKDTLGTSPQVPYTFSQNFSPGHYTVFIADSINRLDQVVVKDNIVVPTDTSSRIRIANFVYAPFSFPGVDVYSFARQANIFTNVTAKTVTDFIPYPSRLVTDTLYFRETGTQITFLKVPFSVLTPKRSYTVLLRGSQPRGTYVGTRTTTTIATF
jgi:hypothetical protein